MSCWSSDCSRLCYKQPLELQVWSLKFEILGFTSFRVSWFKRNAPRFCNKFYHLLNSKQASRRINLYYFSFNIYCFIFLHLRSSYLQLWHSSFNGWKLYSISLVYTLLGILLLPSIILQLVLSCPLSAELTQLPLVSSSLDTYSTSIVLGIVISTRF